MSTHRDENKAHSTVWEQEAGIGTAERHMAYTYIADSSLPRLALTDKANI